MSQPPDDSVLMTRDRCWKCQQPLSTESRPYRSAVRAPETPSSRDSSDEIEALPEPTIGKVGRFELRAALGQGAFGRVFRAYDPLLDRSVALKMPRTTLDQPRRINRFLREAKAAARLRHPNIVTVYESGKAGDEYYIASEFVDGVPLSVRMAERPPELGEAVRWVHQIAEGLAYAHSEGVIHRDIKPSNIMLGESGRPQLMDFGTAKRLDEDATLTTEGSLLGTPAYMAPEQARSETKAIGARSDQYSLGVVLYELITGHKAFEGPPHLVIGKVTNTEPPAPRSINPAIPRDLEAVCLKAMSKEASRRYATVGDFAADLERWLKHEPVQARPVATYERLARWCQRYPAMATMTGLFAVSLTLAAALGITFAVYEFRVAAELARAVQSANTQKLLAEKALNEARFQSRRAGEALRDVQTERDRTAVALRDSEYQRERAEQALADAEQQRTRAETALSELQASRIEAESGRAEVRRLQTETYLDRGLRQCAQGDAVQGMLWLAEALMLASESSDLAEQARVARANLAAWKPAVPRAKKQRSGSVVLDVSLDGARVERGPLRPADLKPEAPKWQPLFRYDEPLAVVFSGDARTAVVLERQAKTIQAFLLGGGLASSPPPFERGKLFRSQAHPVVYLTANGRRALIQEEAGVAVVWDVLGRQAVGQRPLISLGSRRIVALCIGPLGKRAAVITTRSGSASQAPVVVLYNVDSGESMGERELRSGAPPLLALSHNQRWLLAGDSILDAKSLEPVAGPLPFSEPMLSAAFSPGADLLATTSARSIWLWDTSGKLLREIPSTRPVDEIVFDDEGSAALTRDRGHVQIWDVRTGHPVGPAIEAASGMQPFLSAALTPDGESLLLAASREAYRLPLPARDLPGTAEQLRQWVQVYTESELARDGSVRVLDEAAWEARLESLRQSQNTAGTEPVS